MNKSESQIIQGQLINAASGGGEKALWNIARGGGRAAQVANMAIELVTSPFHDVDIVDAIIIAAAEMERGEIK